MAKSGRHSRYPPRKSSPSTLVFILLITISFVVLILLGLGIVSLPSTSSSSKSDTAHDLSSIVRTSVHRGAVGGERTDQWVELISWEPRAFVYHNFLSKEECEYLIELAKPHMQKSSVVDTGTGKGVDSRVRTSSGTFLPRGRDKTMRDIEQRIADWSFIPVDHGEGLQVHHYEEGQNTDVEEGGETIFPNAIENHSALPNWDKLSKCGKGGRSVRPKTGGATFILAEKLHLGGLIGAGIIILGLYTIVWGKTKEKDLSSTAAHDEDNHKGISIITPQQLLPTTNPHVPCT